MEDLRSYLCYYFDGQRDTDHIEVQTANKIVLGLSRTLKNHGTGSCMWLYLTLSIEFIAFNYCTLAYHIHKLLYFVARYHIHKL